MDLDEQVRAGKQLCGLFAVSDLRRAGHIEDVTGGEIWEDETCARGRAEVAEGLVEPVAAVFGVDEGGALGGVGSEADEARGAAAVVGVHG